MPGPLIGWHVKYDPRLTAVERFLFQTLPGRLKRLNYALDQEVVPLFIRMMREQFRTEGAAFGAKWARLAASTLKQKASLGLSNVGILIRSGALFNKATQAQNLDRRFTIIPGGVRLSLTVSMSYAKYHQFGTRRMPRRVIVPDPLPLSFRREVRQAIRGFIFLNSAST